MFRIHAVAGLLWVSASTLRNYEREGRIPKARRTKAGHRYFTLEDVEKIAAVLYPGIDLQTVVQRQGEIMRKARFDRDYAVAV